MKIKTLIPVFSLLLLMSCKTTTNNITYFQDLDNLAANSGDSINYAPKIVPDDELSISVSGVDPNAVAVFNMPLSSYLTLGKPALISLRLYILIWSILKEI